MSASDRWDHGYPAEKPFLTQSDVTLLLYLLHKRTGECSEILKMMSPIKDPSAMDTRLFYEECMDESKALYIKVQTLFNLTPRQKRLKQGPKRR